ncbi:MAG TPA: rhomboid family intramembrane serine protease [Propionibacteriaceae bacterium]|nr:rhomboid family intramembrane serine protease [Propionibacteriaceae bacterium]
MSRVTIDWRRLRTGALVMAAVVAVLWLIEGVDTLTNHALDGLGIRPWNIEGLDGIVFAPLLHASFAHVAANSLPLFVLGTAIWASGLRQWVVATVTGWVTSGILAWLLTPIHYLVLGASGVIFGWITYLIVRGFLSRRWPHIVLGLVIAFLYGSVLLGVFPMSTGVSWQGHLGGALGGVLAAWLLFRRERSRRPRGSVI